MNRTIFVFATVTLLVGCTDAQYSKIAAFGNSAHIKCWSGGEVIYEGTSTGKILETNNSDGYNFRDKETQRLIQVNGDCVITYQE